MRSHISGLFFACLIAVSGIAAPAVAQSPLPKGPLSVPPGGEMLVDERKSYALVIGIDSYRHENIPKLTKAVRDAHAVKAALEAHNFQVTLKTDLASAELAQAITEWFLDKGRDPQARLVFWFAGHGETLKVGDQEAGYLVPIDAPLPKDEVAFKLKAFPVSRLHSEILPSVKARHVLAIFDSCFSGIVFRQRARTRESDEPSSYGHPIRHIITSGTRGQTVADNGEFRRLFVEALMRSDSGADADGNGYVTGYELGQHMIRGMRDAKLPQSPISAPLPATGESIGEFYFRTQRTIAGRASTIWAGTTAPKLSEVVQKCIIGRRHANGPQLASELTRLVDLKSQKMIHTWTVDPNNPAQKDQEAAAPHDIYRIASIDDEVHLSYPGGELVMVPVVDDKAADARQAHTKVLLQGGWRQRAGDGCVEFRFDTATRTGAGKWWIKKRYRYIANPFNMGTPMTSELKVVPR